MSYWNTNSLNTGTEQMYGGFQTANSNANNWSSWNTASVMATNPNSSGNWNNLAANGFAGSMSNYLAPDYTLSNDGFGYYSGGYSGGYSGYAGNSVFNNTTTYYANGQKAYESKPNGFAWATLGANALTGIVSAIGMNQMHKRESALQAQKMAYMNQAYQQQYQQQQSQLAMNQMNDSFAGMIQTLVLAKEAGIDFSS